MTRVARQLAAAIQTMRDACDHAERTAVLADDRAVRRVLHELTWGLANASSSIEGALNALEDDREISAIQLGKDAERLAYVYSGAHTDSNALVELELRLLNADRPTMPEVRAAIDDAMAESK